MRPLLALTLLCCAAGSTCPAVAAEFAIPEELGPAVDRANAAGALLWRHDSAAARATDQLADRGVLEEDDRIRGWLTDEYVSGDEVGVIVTFVGQVDDRTLGLYRVRIPPQGDPVFEALKPEVALDASQQARLQARNSAIEVLEKAELRCGESYNTVVLPASGEHGIRVYLLAATSQPDLVIAGGHYLHEYSAEGTRLLSQRPFTRSCMDIPLKSDKGEIEALTLSHLLDPTPTEVHSYLSRYARKNIYLVTTSNSLVWFLQKGTIVTATSLDEKGGKKKR